MSTAAAHRQDNEECLCTSCSCCNVLLSVTRPAPGTTLIELRCPRCGTPDVYHVNTFRLGARDPLVRR